MRGRQPRVGLRSCHSNDLHVVRRRRHLRMFDRLLVPPIRAPSRTSATLADLPVFPTCIRIGPVGHPRRRPP